MNLLKACKKGNVQRVKFLLEKDCNIETKGNTGWTPLIYSSCYGQFEVTKLLLENGADIEAKDITGQTPLIISSRVGNRESIKILLENGADNEVEDSNGMKLDSYLEDSLKKEIYEFIQDIQNRRNMVKPNKKGN